MRDCDNCARNTPTKGCTSWDCDYINRKEAIDAWLEKYRAEQTEPKCDECLHFDRTYKERGEDGVLVIGVECDGMDKICDKFSTIDCAWK